MKELVEDVSTRLPTSYGEFILKAYRDPADNTKEHLALIAGDLSQIKSPLVRIHSECQTGDIFASLRCDCGYQLQEAMKLIAKNKGGAIIYLRQEGRGIGLIEKLKAYNLQDKGFDTVEANLKLGHHADEREYTMATAILSSLGITSVRLITNNLNKLKALQKAGINVDERIALPIEINHQNRHYLQTKVTKLQHLMDLNGYQ